MEIPSKYAHAFSKVAKSSIVRMQVSNWDQVKCIKQRSGLRTKPKHRCSVKPIQWLGGSPLLKNAIRKWSNVDYRQIHRHFSSIILFILKNSEVVTSARIV